MNEMRIYPLQISNTNEGNIDKIHLSTLNDCRSVLNLELNKIKSNFTSIDVSLDDFNKIQDFKNTLESIDNKIKDINLRVYNKELTLIENFNHTSHKNLFKNTDLKEIIIGSTHYPATGNWYELNLNVSNHLLKLNKELFENKVTKLKGKIKPYFSKDKDELRREKELENTDYLLESNFSAFETVCNCIKILTSFNFNDDVIVVFDNKKS